MCNECMETQPSAVYESYLARHSLNCVQCQQNDDRLEVLKAVLLKIWMLWAMTPSRWVSCYLRFLEACCLHIQGNRADWRAVTDIWRALLPPSSGYCEACRSVDSYRRFGGVYGLYLQDNPKLVLSWRGGLESFFRINILSFSVAKKLGHVDLWTRKK